MNRETKIQIIITTIRIILGIVFIYASIDKMLHPARFAEIVYHYKVVPIELLNIIAILIPWIEAGLGLMLLFDIWTDFSSLVLGLLTFFFIILITSAMARGLNIQCGCFSIDSEASLVGVYRIAEDFILIIGCVILFLNYYKQTSNLKT